MRIVNLVSIGASCAYGIISMWWLTLAASIWSPPCYYFISFFSLRLLFAAAVPVNISEIHLHRSFFSVHFFRLFYFFLSTFCSSFFIPHRFVGPVECSKFFFLLCLSFVCFEPREKEKKLFYFYYCYFFSVFFFLVCSSQGRWYFFCSLLATDWVLALIFSASTTKMFNDLLHCLCTYGTRRKQKCASRKKQQPQARVAILSELHKNPCSRWVTEFG